MIQIKEKRILVALTAPSLEMKKGQVFNIQLTSKRWEVIGYAQESVVEVGVVILLSDSQTAIIFHPKHERLIGKVDVGSQIGMQTPELFQKHKYGAPYGLEDQWLVFID